MDEVLKEVKKLKDSWEYQKKEHLKDERICDAYIHAFDSVIQLLEQEKAKSKKSEKNRSVVVFYRLRL